MHTNFKNTLGSDVSCVVIVLKTNENTGVDVAIRCKYVQ